MIKKQIKPLIIVLSGVVYLSMIFGCKETEGVNGSVNDKASAAFARGKLIYMTRCIACHNADPSQPGAIGPEIIKSSVELIEARVMRGEYPAGYKPKRATKLMVPLPDLKADIEAIATFLNTKE